MKKNNRNESAVIYQPSTTSVWIVNTGLLLVALGTLLPILHIGLEWNRWIFGAGAIATLAGRLMSFGVYRNAPLRIKRLSRIEFWAAVMFAVATFFMFYPGAGATDWLAFTLAGAALQAYCSIMIPRVIAHSS